VTAFGPFVRSSSRVAAVIRSSRGAGFSGMANVRLFRCAVDHHLVVSHQE
jgi:hypothetical protein